MNNSELGALNLNLLPALAALLKAQSVSAAARSMNVSQSAMSHSLARLREMFDDPLLVAAGRGMVRTPLGTRIAGTLPLALNAVSDALRRPAPFDPATSDREFTLATFDYFEITTMPDVMAYLSRHAPGVRLRVERFDSGTAGRMAAGQTELAVVGASLRLPGAGLMTKRLYRDPFVVIARKNHPTMGNRLTLKRYLEANHVLVSIEGRADGAVDRVLNKRGLRRNVALRVPHFGSAPIAVAQSDLICTIAAAVANQAQQTHGLQVFEPPIPVPPAEVIALWPRQQHQDPASAWFRSLFINGTALSPFLKKRLASPQRSKTAI